MKWSSVHFIAPIRMPERVTHSHREIYTMDSSGAHGAKIRFSTQFYEQRSPRDHGPGCHASSSQALPMMASLMPPELGIDDTLLPRWQLHIYITMVSWFLHLLVFVILYICPEWMTLNHEDDGCSSNSLQKRPKMPSAPPWSFGPDLLAP